MRSFRILFFTFIAGVGLSSCEEYDAHVQDVFVGEICSVEERARVSQTIINSTSTLYIKLNCINNNSVIIDEELWWSYYPFLYELVGVDLNTIEYRYCPISDMISHDTAQQHVMEINQNLERFDVNFQLLPSSNGSCKELYDIYCEQIGSLSEREPLCR